MGFDRTFDPITMGAEQSTQVDLLTTQQYQRLFKILDKDGTGQLTGDEVDAMFTAILGFETQDHRGKGACFDIQAFKSVCVRSAKNHPGWNVRSNLQKYIEENRGRVSVEDDLHDEPLGDHNLEKLFKILDTDGSGQLSPMETYQLFVAATLPKRILFDILSADASGYLDFPQFCSVLRSCDEKYPEKGVDDKILNFLQVAMHKGKPPMPVVDVSAPDESGVSELPVGTKKALIVGINYLGTGVQLGGCINDAKAQHDTLLRHFGFKEGNVRLLTDDNDDAKPTKENMLEAMHWLMRDAREGDVLFFHFSGHGSQVTDPTGQEADGKNECLCPVDCMGKPWPAAVIVDDYLNQLFFENLPEGVRLTCVYDCCHSGTMVDLAVNRDIGDMMMGFDADAPKDRFMQPPPEIHEQLMAQSTQRSINTMHSVRSRSLAGPSGPKQLWSISGCQDDQTSADATINGQKRGALTWALTTSLEQCGYNITYDELLTCCRKKLKGKYTQIPQMATTDKRNFDCRYVGCGL